MSLQTIIDYPDALFGRGFKRMCGLQPRKTREGWPTRKFSKRHLLLVSVYMFWSFKEMLKIFDRAPLKIQVKTPIRRSTHVNLQNIMKTLQFPSGNGPVFLIQKDKFCGNVH